MTSSCSTLDLESPTSLYNFVVRDGNGVKGLMDLGLAKVPHKYIHPPHERINDPDSIPVLQASPIDLSKLDGSVPERAQVVAQIVRASKTLGFFQVVNHGVPLELLDKLIEAAHAFFELPVEKKAVYRSEARLRDLPNVKYGTSFVPEKEEIWKWKDFLSMRYNNDLDALRCWPDECKNEALEYLELSTKIVKDILEILISNLGAELEDSKIDGLLGVSKVNINYYPACPNPELTLGVGSHSDFGTLTVLLQDDIGGLYVKLEEDNNDVGNKGDWIQIPPIPGALVINIGDTLQILSNGRYKSAEHRVRTTSNKSRVSVPIFITTKPTEKIGPLPEVVKKDGFARYREIVYQDYMNSYFGGASGGKKSLDFASINSASSHLQSYDKLTTN